jgi:hypothetical protein
MGEETVKEYGDQTNHMIGFATPTKRFSGPIAKRHPIMRNLVRRRRMKMTLVHTIVSHNEPSYLFM